MLAGKVSLCIGATNGIGKAIALHLAQLRSNVIIVGRNPELGQDMVNHMKTLNESGTFKFVKCDASLMSNINEVCTNIASTEERLDYLVLTQGIASVNGRTETSEGIEQKLALHYYGRVLAVRCLLPLLSKTAAQAGSDVRVLNVLSAGVHAAFVSDDIELKHSFSIANAANAAGFYNDLAMDELARENPSISFIHAAPGFVQTNWGSAFPWPLLMLIRFAQLFAMTPEQCAATMSRALVEADWKGGFKLMGANGQPAVVTKQHTEEQRQRIWTHTLALFDRLLKK